MSTTSVATSSIKAAENVRELSKDRVAALSASIKQVGVIVPLVVKSAEGGGWELVAGAHRLAAAKLAKLTEIPVVVRDSNGHGVVDAAVENIARWQLTPVEEALAVERVLAAGYTDKGAAQVLGVSAKLVAERKRILELPEQARAVFDGRVRPSAAALLVKIYAVLGAAAGDVALEVAQGDNGTALLSDRSWQLVSRLQGGTGYGKPTPPVAWDIGSNRLDPSTLPNLTKETQQKIAALAVTRHGYTEKYTLGDWQKPPLGRNAVSEAKAAGILLELGQAKLVGDVEWLRDRVVPLVDRDHAKHEKAAAAKTAPAGSPSAKAAAAKEDKEKAAGRLDREFKTKLRVRAIAVNHELGARLKDKLADVELTKDVALAFSRIALGPKSDGRGYGAGERSRGLARIGWRLIDPELVTVEEVTLKSGKPGRPKIAWSDDAECEAAMWAWIEGAATPTEILGRSLAVLAAARLSLGEALSSSEFAPRVHLGAGSEGVEAIDRVVKAAVPASHGALRKEISEWDPAKAAKEVTS